MPLNSNQQAALDAFVDTLDPVAPPPASPSLFWLPSGADAQAFADEFSIPVNDVLGWDGVEPNTAQKRLPALDGYPATSSGSAGSFTVKQAATAAALRYAAFGYRVDGSRWNWRRQDLKAARDLCTTLWQETDPEKLDALIPGAKFMDPIALNFAVMCGYLPGNPIVKCAPDEAGIIGPLAGQLAVTVEDVILTNSFPPNQPWG